MSKARRLDWIFGAFGFFVSLGFCLLGPVFVGWLKASHLLDSGYYDFYYFCRRFFAPATYGLAKSYLEFIDVMMVSIANSLYYLFILAVFLSAKGKFKVGVYFLLGLWFFLWAAFCVRY